MIGSNVLVINPEAQLHHDVGLRAELDGDYDGAHVSFGYALNVLQNDLAFGTVDSIVQGARIVRDDGFTYVREAITLEDPRVLNLARQALTASIEATAPFVSGTNYAEAQSILPHDTPKRGRREVFAEHGASIGLLGRLATVEAVMLGVDTRDINNDAALLARRIGQQPYGLAHDILRVGGNGYYRVSNAMNGARAEKLNGRRLHMAVWLGRAAYGALWTIARDQRNILPTWRTIGSRARHLRSYRAALESITTAP